MASTLADGVDTSDSMPDLKSLTSELAAAAQSYNPSLGESGQRAERLKMLSVAKQINAALTSPQEATFDHIGQVCLYGPMILILFLDCWLKHSLTNSQMADLMSIRTLMHLGVLKSIPANGSISLDDLAKKTGVQESLLGKVKFP